MHSSELPTPDDASKSSPARKRAKKRFGIEYRPTEKALKDGLGSLWRDPRRWRAYRWYETAEDRDKAMAALTTKTCYSFPSFYEYWPAER